MRSEFDTRAHVDKAEWLEYSKKLKSLEQAAKQDPARAALEMEEIAHDDYRHWQSVLRNRFGIDWRLPGRASVLLSNYTRCMATFPRPAGRRHARGALRAATRK